MSVLRVLLTKAPSPASDDPWALFDAQERNVRSGHGTPSTWPAADRREAVLAASAVRLAGIVLPPMPADRVAAAAAFALEDQLAGPAHEQHLVASPRRRDGGVEVAIAARSLFAPLQKGIRARRGRTGRGRCSAAERLAVVCVGRRRRVRAQAGWQRVRSERAA